MKCFRRCCYVFLCSVLLLIAFSGIVSAETVPFNDYKVTHKIKASYFGQATPTFVSTVVPNDSELKNSGTHSYVSLVYNGSPLTYNVTFVIEENYIDGVSLQDRAFIGRDKNITLKGVNFVHNIFLQGTPSVYPSSPSTVRFLLFYTNGEMEYVDNVPITRKDQFLSFEGSFKPKYDVYKIEVLYSGTMNVPDTYGNFTFQGTVGNYFTKLDGFNVLISEEPENTGLLKGIIEWLKGIKTGITDVFNSIAELPSKIANFLIEGIKSLFVPSQEDITTFFDSLDNLLEERLGAVYQVTHIMFESWDRITANDQNNTINIPSATIPLPEGNSFTFGGYDVSIVPDGFDWLASTIKTLVGIVCTLSFVNGMRKKYDEVMGVEK